VERLFQVKQRPVEQPVSGLFHDHDQAATYVVWTPAASALAEKFLPGPLTIILPLKEEMPMLIFPTPGGGKNLGVRISSHPVAQMLAAKMGRPITTTSANLHGKPNPYSADDIRLQFAEQKLQPTLILDSGILPPTPPSTVVDLTGGATPQTLRKGNIDTL
jgi:L-threonylcarbamoyladenylate synthase